MELVAKSREAAISAIRVFNDPNVAFKSETFIVLMAIAWTYLLHAHYRGKGIEYRYFKQGEKTRRFDRTKSGAYKYWELERCLNDERSPVDPATALNLRFLIGLRHEIEHQMTRSLDGFLSGRYQACALNYNDLLKQLFGKRLGLDSQMAYSIQFLQLTDEQLTGPHPAVDVPARLRAFIADFDSALSHDQYNDPRFSYRLLFKRKMVNHPGQADRVIEFIDPKSDLAKTIDKEYWVKKEVERPKFRPKDVVDLVRQAGFVKFRVQPDHVSMWKAQDAKSAGKGFGTTVQGVWYWYQTWVDKCIELCGAEGEKYRANPA